MPMKGLDVADVPMVVGYERPSCCCENSKSRVMAYAHQAPCPDSTDTHLHIIKVLSPDILIGCAPGGATR